MIENMNNKKQPDMDFEDDLNRLKEIVKMLEQGNLSLDKSLKLFEEGIKLYRKCNNALQHAEQKISILLYNEDENLEERPFIVNEEE